MAFIVSLPLSPWLYPYYVLLTVELIQTKVQRAKRKIHWPLLYNCTIQNVCRPMYIFVEETLTDNTVYELFGTVDHGEQYLEVLNWSTYFAEVTIYNNINRQTRVDCLTNRFVASIRTTIHGVYTLHQINAVDPAVVQLAGVLNASYLGG